MNIHATMGGNESLLDVAERADRIARNAAQRADRHDHDGAFPVEDIEEMATEGLLLAPLPVRYGGMGLGTSPAGAQALLDVLRSIGRGSLSLGRLYEGHVNAILLITRYGTEEQLAVAARDASAGRLFGVWNTDGRDHLHLAGTRLVGGKVLASGAGYVERPVVTAHNQDGDSLMVLLRLTRGERADLSSWRAHGMRASATGSIDLTGLQVSAADVIGGAGDYVRQPTFSTGAWRFAAVQLGGMEALVTQMKRHLVGLDRHCDSLQQARAGEALIAMETAHLWWFAPPYWLNRDIPMRTQPLLTSISHAVQWSARDSIFWSVFSARSAWPPSCARTPPSGSRGISRPTFGSLVPIAP
jgi:alkylation response protein AidB-like acyl-CoA dehydrogenase